MSGNNGYFTAPFSAPLSNFAPKFAPKKSLLLRSFFQLLHHSFNQLLNPFIIPAP